VGAAAARPFVQLLRAASDDGEKILELVREAEQEQKDNLYALSEIYGVAVDLYSRAHNTQDYDLSDLSVKRMRLLCRLNPAEAREFHNRLRAYSTGRADARMYEARAEMENRLGDAAKAIKMLQEGLRVGAQPEDALRRQLKKLQPVERSSPSTPSAATPVQAATSASPVSPSQLLAAPTPSVQKLQTITVTPQPKQSISATAQSATARPASIPGATVRPRLLGLGPAERVLPGEEDGHEEEEDEEEEVHSCEEGDEEDDEDQPCDVQDRRLSTTMGSTTHAATLPLSPIQEVESPREADAEATCESNPRTGDTRISIPPPGSTAPTPQRQAIMATPRRGAQHDLSMDSGAPSAEKSQPSQPTPSRSSKSILVNGVAYTQIHKIGRGGSSKVYLVHTPSGEAVALKRVTTDSAKQLEAFQNEVDLLLRLRGKDHIIQVLDAEIDRERGRIHIVMEAGDMDLNRFLQSEPRLSLSKVQNIWRQMLEAVQVIHNARIVHSDLKPGNFVLVGGKLKVIDFGIAKRISNDTTNISRDASVGTLSYMAPEAVKSGSLKLGRSSDIWSLGIILYQIVYQQPPFAHLEPMQRVFMLNSPDLKIMFPEGHCLDDRSSTTKAQLLDVLGGCLERDPRRRPSIPDLLVHPFLKATVEVRRETLACAVSSVMGRVVQALGTTLQDDVVAPAGNWDLLADEVWEQVSGIRSASSDEASDFDGLAPLSALAERFADLQRQRDFALAEARRHEARNVELEEHLRRLAQGSDQPPRGLSDDCMLKNRGQMSSRTPNLQQRSESKENIISNNAREGKLAAEDDVAAQHPKVTRQCELQVPCR
jgi:serine/threonine-protein kinase TTK/MPS1